MSIYICMLKCKLIKKRASYNEFEMEHQHSKELKTYCAKPCKIRKGGGSDQQKKRQIACALKNQITYSLNAYM